MLISRMQNAVEEASDDRILCTKSALLPLRKTSRDLDDWRAKHHIHERESHS